MKHSLLFFCYWILLAHSHASAQVYAPKYSNEFLSIGVGARGQGMANAQVGIVQDLTAGYWNPAGLASMPSKYEAAFMHAEYFAGIANYDYLGFATAIDSQSTFGISAIRLSIDDIADTRYLIVGDVIDYSRVRSFSASDNALLLSYARKNVWAKGLNVGANFKIIYRNAGTFANAWGFGLDAGLQYRRNRWMLGLLARDVTSTFNAWSFNTTELAAIYTQTGNKIPESSIEITLPKWIMGIGREVRIYRQWHALAALDAEMTFDGQRNAPISTKVVSIDPRAGIELGYAQTAFVRIGASNIQKVKQFDNTKKVTFMPNFGVGIRYKQLSLDYALTDLGNQSEALYSNIFSLKIAIK